MTQLNNTQARIVDPILTEVARGYSQNDFIGMNLFPRVPVRQRGGQIITFGKEAFMQYNNIIRSPGQNTKRVTFGYAGAPFALRDYSLEGVVPVETQQEAQAAPGIDLAARTVEGVQQIIANRLEIEQAALATNPANYPSANKVTLSGTAQWSDPASDPFADIQAAKEAIRTATGKLPTVLAIGAAAYAALQRHSKITGRLQYTTSAIPTASILAALFDVREVVVGRSIYSTDAGVSVDTWGKVAVLAFTPVAGLAAQGLPSYGYTYQLEGYPDVEEPYMDRNAKSWLYPVTDAVAPVIAGVESGFLINAAVA